VSETETVAVPVAPANSSVIDRMRASGMTDDQILNAIMSFGSGQQQQPVPVATGNDAVSQMKAQGLSPEQITAAVVASAQAANVTGSGDPTAGGGAPTVPADVLDAHKADVAGTVAVLLEEHKATVDEAVSKVGDVVQHSQRLRNVEVWIEEHGHELLGWFREHRAALEELLQVGVTIATDVAAGGK